MGPVHQEVTWGDTGLAWNPQEGLVRTVDVKDIYYCVKLYLLESYLLELYLLDIYIKGPYVPTICDSAEQSTCRCNCNLSWKLVNTDVILIISITVDIVPINYLD